MDDKRERAVDERVETAREQLGTRLDVLEQRVVNAVDEASAAVRGTADSVQHMFDVAQHVREHPWPSLGLAAAAGFFTGFLMRRPAPRQLSAVTKPATSGRRSALADLFDVARREFTKLGEEAIVAGVHALKQNFQDVAAEIVKNHAHQSNGVPCNA